MSRSEDERMRAEEEEQFHQASYAQGRKEERDTMLATFEDVLLDAGVTYDERKLIMIRVRARVAKELVKP